MESFGSSLVFCLVKDAALVWLQFGYSSGGFGLSKWLLAMPLVVRGWAASLRVVPHFGAERTSIKNVTVSVFDPPLWDWETRVCYWSPPARCVAQWHPHSACRWLTALRGQSSAQEWQGSGVRGRGHRELGHILAPERTNSNTFQELRVFFF